MKDFWMWIIPKSRLNGVAGGSLRMMTMGKKREKERREDGWKFFWVLTRENEEKIKNEARTVAAARVEFWN